MRAAPAASLLAAAALALAACGGGGDKAATTTSSPPSTEASTTTALSTTTFTTIDPALKELLLVRADLPTGFEEVPGSASGPAQEEASACDAVGTPAGDAVKADPGADGATFERGSGDTAVEVSSSVTRTTPEKAEAAMVEILDPKLRECLEADVKAATEPGLPAGSSLTLKTSAAKATVSGVDQAVLFSSSVTAKSGTETLTVRFDVVGLRKEGTLYQIVYTGPNPEASSAERQRIVAAAARKLSATGTSGTSTTAGSGGSSTSSTRGSGSSTTRRSTSTTRGGSTSSSRSSTTRTTL